MKGLTGISSPKTQIFEGYIHQMWINGNNHIYIFWNISLFTREFWKILQNI